jgi:HAD superfamily hydrolase (TIGR01549 family)
MDGTLTRTNQLIYDSFNHVAEKYINKRLSPAEIVALFGPPEKEAVENMIGSRHIDAAMEEYYDFYRIEHHRLASLFPGVIEILQFLKTQGVLIALFTGKGRKTTDISLREFGIAGYFDMTVTGDDVDEFKPSGDGIRKIMEKYSLDPSEVLMVGDAVADFKASRETGVDIATVVWDSYAKDEVMQLPSDFHFHDVDVLAAWLNKLYS